MIEKGEELLVGNGDAAGNKISYQFARQPRGGAHGKSVSFGPIGEADVVNRESLKAGEQSQQHAGGIDRIDKGGMHRVTEEMLQAEGDPARGAPHPAGKVHQKGMVIINRYTTVRELHF